MGKEESNIVVTKGCELNKRDGGACCASSMTKRDDCMGCHIIKEDDHNLQGRGFVGYLNN